MQPLDLVSFDAAEYESCGDHEGVRRWRAPSGDMVGLFYFALPPDIVADLRSITAVRDFYRKMVKQSGAAIVEVETPEIAGCLTTRLIVKVPQNPTGMTYVGSITLPFRDFSYVLKAQCEERGVTGMRDAVVLDEKFGSGYITPDNEGILRGWMRDPYDSSLKDGFAMNLSEEKQYDDRFPNHPLSRLRRLLDHLQGTLQVSGDLKSKPRL